MKTLGKPIQLLFDRGYVSEEVLTMNDALVELWAWDKDETYLKRYRTPWDDFPHRPSHKKKRMALQLELQ